MQFDTLLPSMSFLHYKQVAKNKRIKTDEEITFLV